MGDTTALIVGAGPTGLTLGCVLRQQGIDVRLVERLTEPVETSRAFTIHARTLELFGSLALDERFRESSHETYSMDYHFPGMEETPCLDFRALDSVFPFCLTINQVDTEALLRARFEELGGAIDWGHRLVGFAASEDGVTATIEGPDGVETLQADWMVGCDGIASAVRAGLELPFDGSEYAGTMRMVDAPLSGYSGTDSAIHYHVARDHMLLITKLPGPNHRVLISDKTEGVPPEEAQGAFQEVLDQHFGGEVKLGELAWATNFRISKRATSAYRKGRVFLAGDAAHVNSPAGGQGMNVAIQDAFNLGWKLAAVARGEAPTSLLDTYESERRPVALQMLEGTSYIHSIIMAHGKGMTERIALMKGGEWNAQAVNQVAGISYTYRAEDVGDEVGLAEGDRAPDGRFADGSRYYDLFRPGRHTLLLLGDGAGRGALSAIAEQISSRYRAALDVRLVLSGADGSEGPPIVVDDGAFAGRYGLTEGTRAVHVRPDLHVGYLGAPEGVPAALDRLLARA